LETSHPTARVAARRVRPAFTLTELLVCAAVIALLVSMMVPYFGRAREKVRLTICRSHLRNVGVGLTAYVARNNSHLPVAEQLDNPHGELLGALLGTYVGEAESFYCPSETKEDLRFCRENLDANRIGYFYFCCRRPTRNRGVSTFLRWDVEYPRLLDTRMPPETWVISDAWFGGEPTAHRWYPKGVNYLTLGGDVRMIEHRPRAAFR
jgi:prepilin-type N-terminal cleavage/methylation domain-containing protein